MPLNQITPLVGIPLSQIWGPLVLQISKLHKWAKSSSRSLTFRTDGIKLCPAFLLPTPDLYEGAPPAAYLGFMHSNALFRAGEILAQGGQLEQNGEIYVATQENFDDLRAGLQNVQSGLKRLCAMRLTQ